MTAPSRQPKQTLIVPAVNHHAVDQATASATDHLREADLARLLTIQKWARLLDARFTIPGTNIRYGWDSIIGLVPWAGDLLTGAVGAWLVYLAYRVGVPQSLLVQMIVNIVIDFAAGSVPVVGDIFDLAFKAHIRNAILIENFVKESGLAAAKQS